MKKYLFLLISFISITSFSQELVASIPLQLKQNRDVFQIVNNTTKNVTMFLSDKKSLNAVRLNDKMEIIDSMTTTRPEKKFSEMIGYSSNADASSRVFWATSNKKELFVQNFDFGTHIITSQNYTLDLKGEEVITNFTASDTFYLVTIIKKSNDLKFYTFDSFGKMDVKTVSLEHLKFFMDDYTPATFYQILNQNLLPFEREKVQKIISNHPISLTESAKKRKLYIRENEIVFSMDSKIDFTQLIFINLENYSIVEKTFKKAYIVSDERYLLNSNSFLIDDKLFQIKTSSSEMFFITKDMEDKTLQQFYVSKDKEIEFKNTDVIQEGGDFGNKRILDRSSQFLRKVNNSNSGISCYKVNDQYIVTVGSVSQDTSNAAMYGAMFGVAGVLVAAAISNPTYDSFNSYANRKVIYTNGLFDLKTNHIAGTIKPFAFDKIRSYLDSNKNLNSKTLFKLSDSYYLGSYDVVDKKYNLRKFED